MKAASLGLAAAGLVAASAGSAQAQVFVGGWPVYRPVPVYSAPVVSVGFGFGNPGFRVGGFYSNFPAYGLGYPRYVWGGYPGFYRPSFGYPGGFYGGGYRYNYGYRYGYRYW
jgi:hypothetical protein